MATTARVAGACNAVRLDAAGRLVGEMFDGEGFVRGVQRKGRKLQGAGALVVGAGGVGSAIAASLAKAGVARLGALRSARAGRWRRWRSGCGAHYPALEVATGSKDPGRLRHRGQRDARSA